MGLYCCCGQRQSDPCTCDKQGWHNIYENKDELPKEDGLYLVRYHEDGECNEVESKFSVIPIQWSRFDTKLYNWEVELDDGYLGFASVSEWKEIVNTKKE